MAQYSLDEYEAEEIYHALLGRKIDLDKTAKNLEEKDGLPEAAQAVRTRIELYTPNGEGKAARVGLIRMFAPQRDIQAEADANRAAKGEERSPDGQQDAFGGGAATGGGHPAGEIVPGAGATKKPRRKKKGADGAAEPNDADVVEADYEIVGESHRLGGPTTPTLDGLSKDGLDALARLEAIASRLVNGPAEIAAEEFDAETAAVLELLPKVNHGIDPTVAATAIAGIPTSENAHRLAFYVTRQTSAIRGETATPPGDTPPEGADVPSPGDAVQDSEPSTGETPSGEMTASGARADAADGLSFASPVSAGS